MYSPVILCLQGHLLPGRHVWFMGVGWEWFSTQGSGGVTNAKYSFSRVESYLGVPVADTTERGSSVKSLGEKARHVYQVCPARGQTSRLGRELRAAGLLLVPQAGRTREEHSLLVLWSSA